MQSAADAVF